jgi:hypothetical protein
MEGYKIANMLWQILQDWLSKFLGLEATIFLSLALPLSPPLLYLYLYLYSFIS